MKEILIIGIIFLIIKIVIILLICAVFLYIFILRIGQGKIYNRFRINLIMKKVKKMGPIKPEKGNKIFITGHISEDKIIKVIRTLPEYKYIKKYIKPDNINCTYALFGIMNKKKLCELIGCKESKYHNMLISKDDLIYLLISRKDYVKLLECFYQKLKKLKLIY